MTRIGVLKALQLAASVGALVLFWLVYPGAMMLFGSLIGLCYLLASFGALWNIRVAIFVAFAFSMLTAILSASGVYLFLKNDFDFLAGNYAGRGAGGFYLPPYLFVLVAAASATAVVLHVLTWPWMIKPRATRFEQR